MKVLFAGPSIFGQSLDLTGIDLRPPAQQGDVARAVLEGAWAIGLVDGAFEAIAATWHKEILFALQNGVRVLGAASMGALRAAECASFGMEPIGEIARAYLDGSLDDDASVAIQHAPAELGYCPLTEALVDAHATIERLAVEGEISQPEREALMASATGLFFKERTVEALVEAALPIHLERRAQILALYRRDRVSVKALDAALLVAALREAVPHKTKPIWTMAEPKSWRRALEGWREESKGTEL